MIRWLVVVTLLGTELTAQDELLRRPFGVLDQNKDGFITKDEYPGNPAVLRLMDKNRDKKVDFAEYKVSPLARRYLAAARANRDAPRERRAQTELTAKRLELLQRFDKNRDGKIVKREWTGPPEAFRTLDIDGNGVLDKKDRAQASSEDEVLRTALQKLPRVKQSLPSADRVLRAYDKDKNGLLDKKEAQRSPLKKLFRYADTSGDQQITKEELVALIRRVNAAVTERNRGYSKARAPTIPFKTWDKDKDGRLDIKEWVDRKYLFKLMDINRDAAVTAEEVLRYKRAFEGTNFLERFDLNGDKKVTREEFAGTRAAFDRADRNGDGVISSRDR